jgi:hypothetical protein
MAQCTASGESKPKRQNLRKKRSFRKPGATKQKRWGGKIEDGLSVDLGLDGLNAGNPDAGLFRSLLGFLAVVAGQLSILGVGLAAIAMMGLVIDDDDVFLVAKLPANPTDHLVGRFQEGRSPIRQDGLGHLPDRGLLPKPEGVEVGDRNLPDEFEELAASRDEAERIDRSITNEFLKQVPLLKNQANKVLLVCATNYVRQLDAALLRPGRFDCIIPVGFLDDDGRRTILQYHNARINVGDIDLDLIVKNTRHFTPADLEHLYQLIAQYVFDREYETGKDFAVTTECIMEKIGLVRPSLTDEVMPQFQEDVLTYSRY